MVIRISKNAAALMIFGAVALSILLILPTDDLDSGISLFTYYGRLGLNSFSYFGVYILQFTVIFLIARLTFFVVTLVRKREEPLYLFKPAFIKRKCRRILNTIGKIVGIFIPILVGVSLLTLALSRMNAVNVSHLQDFVLADTGYKIFGVYPFIAVTSVEYPEFFLVITRFVFSGIYPIVALLFFYLYICHRKHFFDLVTSFFISFALMVPLWNVFPALSPHDRYIDNVYNLEIQKPMRVALANYAPQSPINDFLIDMRKWKEQTLTRMPTSTFPSAHVAWAFFFVFYLGKVRYLYGLLGLPVFVLVSIGTVVFAQHYAVDVPAGLLIAALSVWITSLLPDNLYLPARIRTK